MRRTQKQTARGRWLGLILLTALIGVPLIEIALFIQVGGWLGLVPTLILIVLTAVVGAWMLRVQGFAVLTRAQRQLAEGVLPVAEVFEGLCLLVAGALLLTPGFLTDAIGALLLVPACRALLYRLAGQRLELRVAAASQAARGPEQPGRVAGRQPGPVVDAEFREVASEGKPAAQEPRPSDPTPSGPDMPPPRGDWSRRS